VLEEVTPDRGRNHGAADAAGPDHQDAHARSVSGAMPRRVRCRP
jgi:hypothetical protein